MSKDRIGQWFVDAHNSRDTYGPIRYQVGNRWQIICRLGGISESSIAAGIWLRIPPKPDLPPGKWTRECRLPKKGERLVDSYGNIYFADYDWVADATDDFGGRCWIIEKEQDDE